MQRSSVVSQDVGVGSRRPSTAQDDVGDRHNGRASYGSSIPLRRRPHVSARGDGGDADVSSSDSDSDAGVAGARLNSRPGAFYMALPRAPREPRLPAQAMS